MEVSYKFHIKLKRPKSLAIFLKHMLKLLTIQARSSGGERFLDTEEAGGSRPPAPTITIYV